MDFWPAAPSAFKLSEESVCKLNSPRIANDANRGMPLILPGIST